MQHRDLERYKNMLLDMRVHLNDEIRRSIDAVAEDVQPTGEDSKEPSEGLDKELALEKNQEDMLNAINGALDRISDGSYGRCVGCGIEITRERLDAIPYTSYCVDCEKKQEAL